MKAWTIILTYVVVLLTGFYSSPAYQSIDLKGDNLTWFYNPPKLVGEGEVKVKLGEISIDAERVEISLDTSELQAIGRVKLCFYPYTIQGKNLFYNFSKKQGTLEYPQGKEGPIIFRAEKASFFPEGVELKNSSFTTCEYERPHYHVKARVIQIYPEEKMVAKGAIFYLGSLPIFWTPLFIYNFREKSHFILPRPGYSEFSGWYVRSGYYLYISPLLQGEFRLDWREKKGWAGGFSFLSNGEKRVTFITYYLKEKNSGQERGMLKIRCLSPFFSRWRLRLSVDYFSDREILENYVYFLSSEEKEVLPSFLSLSNSSSTSILEMRWQPRVTSFVDYPELLPRLTMGFFQPDIFSSGLYLKEKTELTNFLQDKNKVLTRAYSRLNLSYPLSFLKYFRLKPFLEWKIFYYQEQDKFFQYKIVDGQGCKLFFQLTGKRKDFTHELLLTLGYHKEDKLGKELPVLDVKERELLNEQEFTQIKLQNFFYRKGSPFLSLELETNYNLLTRKMEPLNAILAVPFSQSKIYGEFSYNFYKKEVSYFRWGMQLEGKKHYLEGTYSDYPDYDRRLALLAASLKLSEKLSISTQVEYDLEQKSWRKLNFSFDAQIHCLGAKLEIKNKPQIEYGLSFYIAAFS